MEGPGRRVRAPLVLRLALTVQSLVAIYLLIPGAVMFAALWEASGAPFTQLARSQAAALLAVAGLITLTVFAGAWLSWFARLSRRMCAALAVAEVAAISLVVQNVADQAIGTFLVSVAGVVLLGVLINMFPARPVVEAGRSS